MHYIWTHFLKSYRMFALLGMIGKGIEVVFEVLVPTIIMLLLDRGLALHDLQVSAFYVALLVICACISFCSTLGCQYIAAYISQSHPRYRSHKPCLWFVHSSSHSRPYAYGDVHHMRGVA